MIELDIGTAVLDKAPVTTTEPLQGISPPWWLWTNIVSLDAVSVAVIWQLVFSRTYQAQTGAEVSFVLGCSVWVIYAMDHLLDTVGPPGPYEPARKAFFRRYRRLLSGLTAIGALSTLLFARQLLSPKTFHAGLVCGILVVLYFSAVHFLPSSIRAFWPRQAAIAALFSIGVAMPAWLQARSDSVSFIAAFVLFLMLCWLNCCSVEVWEWQQSIQRSTGPDRCAQWLADHLVLNAGIVISVTLLLKWWGVIPWPLATSTFLSGTVFITIALWRKENVRRRTAVSCVLLDIALMTPLFLIVRK